MAPRSLVTILALAGLAFSTKSADCVVREKATVIPDGWQQLTDEVQPDARLRLSIALRQPELKGLESKIRSGTFLSKQEVDDLRIPDQQDIDEILEWLAENGITDAKADRAWVHVHTTVGEAEPLLQMKLSRYAFEEQQPVLRTMEYSIPKHLSDAIGFVHPVANFMVPKNELTRESVMMSDPLLAERADGPCVRGTTPKCIRELYGLNYNSSYDASPTRFGIAGFLEEYGNYNDLKQFLKSTSPNIPEGYNFSVQLVNGGQNSQDPRESGLEAALDLDYGMALGYPTNVTYYSTGGRGVKLNDSGQPYPEEFADNEPYLEFLQYLLDLSDDELPHVLSISYADDEVTVPFPYAQRVCELFGMLTARGTTVLSGSGDGGARGARNSSCRTNDGTKRDVTMAVFPASCPWVTGVGATTNREEPPPAAAFSGGGFSQIFPRPDWQDETVDEYITGLDGFLEPYYNGSMRAVPDISALGTQFATIVASQVIRLEGTSASTPVLAAMIALINDARVREGKKVLGWINELLYSKEVRDVLQDITEGQSESCIFQDGNEPGGWPAKAGWDAVTGLGVPNNFQKFLNVLLEHQLGLVSPGGYAFVFFHFLRRAQAGLRYLSCSSLKRSNVLRYRVPTPTITLKPIRELVLVDAPLLLACFFGLTTDTRRSFDRGPLRTSNLTTAGLPATPSPDYRLLLPLLHSHHDVDWAVVLQPQVRAVRPLRAARVVASARCTFPAACCRDEAAISTTQSFPACALGAVKMPTKRISPDSDELLQDVAQSLLKARKVVVVTGAGISTNSGIPDFRSENGLYSLIQAQFDAAARQGPPASQSASDKSEDSDDGHRPPKRRRISPGPELPSETSEDTEPVKDVIEVCEADTIKVCEPDTIEVRESDTIEVHEPDTIEVHEPDTIIVQPKNSITAKSASQRPSRRNSVHRDTGGTGGDISTPPSRPRQPLSISLLPTSPLSSPPPEGSPASPNAIPSFNSARLNSGTPLPSSPLSSPPAVIFEPSAPSSPSEGSSDGRSSTSPSEVDETPPSLSLLSSSQTSNNGRTSLPNMKGKDLFDAAIWSDPLRTSVFYTFATSLRQKIKDIKPTSSHRFISHLRDRGKLVRCYTQNIDQIEEKVGLSTCLTDGPGSRGRFSRRSTANATQLNKMVEEAADTSTDTPAEKADEAEEHSQQASNQSQEENSGVKTEEDSATAEPKTATTAMKRETSRSGVECVFLHGSLEQLRCFLCGRVCSWDDADREVETLSGQQPECPHCAGATAARQERGKRALGVGKLRPDIVLYGEEHPNAHLISPIVTHDLALQPDMLLILGTSLRVHGLKVMVREFAKAVHMRGGKVVFVNFTKPPESSWGDIIDYWVQWDCDAWVANLQDRVPKLWQEPEPCKPKKKRDTGGASDDVEKSEVKKPPAAYPVALRDTKAVGAYWTMKIIADLHKITGTPPVEPLSRRASVQAATSTEPSIEVAAKPPPQLKEKTRARRARKSAPGALERPKKPPSTLNPNHGRARRKADPSTPEASPMEPQAPPSAPEPIQPPQTQDDNSIVMSVKSKARVRKPKVRYDGEPTPPVTRKRRGNGAAQPVILAVDSSKAAKADLKLAPFKPQPANGPTSPYGKPEPLEPKAFPMTRSREHEEAFRLSDSLRGLSAVSPKHGPEAPYQRRAPPRLSTRSAGIFPTVVMATTPVTPTRADEKTAVEVLQSLRGSPIMTRASQHRGGVPKELMPSQKDKIESFGSHLKTEFPFDPKWTNFNHGSFGSIPKAIYAKQREYQDQCEARPDQYIRYDFPKLLDESRAAVAELLNVPTDTVVFVHNATVGVNTVFRNLEWSEDGGDVVVFFSTAYGACAKIVYYLVDYYQGKVGAKVVQLTYPEEDEDVLAKFRAAVKEVEAEGKRVRACMFDVVSSLPGVNFPWEAMIKACRELNILSVVDGAQGVGLVPLDLSAADPDFFVSNCHKWLYAPRGCAVFYVPLRNQALLPTTLATSHGYVPRTVEGVRNPLPPSGKSAFVTNFQFVGTNDDAPYACVKDAIAYRRDVLGGEDRIMAYQRDLSRRGSDRVAEALGTHVLDNKAGTLRQSAMANIALPIWYGEKGEGAGAADVVVSLEDAPAVHAWMLGRMMDEHATYVATFGFQGRFWVRLSAQLYLGMEDYEFVGKVLKELVRRVGEGEYLKN
ncbi:Hercynylcysteine sulfoxide lyase [Paramyrothecium foliicola]|nr:Hercynylcysteine sulfoxide lyase [Paramyrothecium foliicola]